MAALIAVPASRLLPGAVPGWSTGGSGVGERYLAALARAGLTGVVVPPPDPGAAAEVAASVAAAVDGVLLAGGSDVDPARYGAEPAPEVYGVDPARDALEVALVAEAERRRLPLLGICRGFQLLNVARGARLIQHLPGDPRWQRHGRPLVEGPAQHAVRVSPGSRVAAATGRLRVDACVSHHHQGLTGPGRGLVAVGWSDDGLVEAVEADPGEPWTLAVQWHPEATAGVDPCQQALFDAFGAAVLGR